METQLETLAPPRGQTETRIVNVSDLLIPEYQRRFNAARAKVISEGFNEDLFIPPRVRPRTDGKFDVLDGQHTVGALRNLGEQRVEVSIVYVSDEDAAGLFADLNQKRKKLTPFETFRAERYAGRKYALLLDQLVTRYGCEVAEYAGPTHMRCITEAAAILRRPKGEVLLDRTLRTLTRTFRPSDARLSRSWIVGVSRLIQALEAAKVFDEQDLYQRLRHATFTVEGAHKVSLGAENLELACEAQMQTGKIRLGATRSTHGASLYAATLALTLYGVKRARELMPQDVR